MQADMACAGQVARVDDQPECVFFAVTCSASPDGDNSILSRLTASCLRRYRSRSSQEWIGTSVSAPKSTRETTGLSVPATGVVDIDQQQTTRKIPRLLGLCRPEKAEETACSWRLRS